MLENPESLKCKLFGARSKNKNWQPRFQTSGDLRLEYELFANAGPPDASQNLHGHNLHCQILLKYLLNNVSNTSIT